MNAPADPNRAARSASPSAQWRGGAIEAYLLLCFGMACWGANSVAGRMAIGQVSPMVITCFRWAAVSAFLAVTTGREMKVAWPELRPHLVKLILMAAGGFAAFNALFYVAAHHTTAVNMSILQGSIPIYVVIGAAFLHRAPIRLLQVAGIVATLLGVFVVATGGHLLTLADFTLNMGDALILVACLLYAGYTLALRNRPKVPRIVLFAALAFLAFLLSLPLLAYEVAAGDAQWPTLEGWLILAFIILFPSFLSQLAYMRGVELIGPGRASLFTNLVPIFGALFGVVLLDEPFGLFHLVALLLVVVGILVAELGGRIGERPVPPDSAE
ncbi:MAG: DMT family transporter [Rhizobiales bacterium]|nr:DMT family transporter [Hyphomicrobiales bacterium]